jgi:hypothetical protein
MKKFTLVAVIAAVTGFFWETNVGAQTRNAKAEAAAKQALETFMTHWNTGDDAKLRTAMNFPFVTLVGGSRVFISDKPEEFSQGFDRMREREGWTSSSFSYDTLKIFMATENKVHLSIDYNRFKGDREKYSTGNVFYVINKKDGHWGVQLRSPVSDEATGEARDKILAGARDAVVGYMKAFNASDAKGTSTYLNYPHLFLMRGGVGEAKAAEGALPNFGRMRESENWHFSIFDQLEPSIVTPTKVHWEIVFTRCHPDGTKYWTVPAVWVTTKVDGHWGIQFRSLMQATLDERK